MTTALFTPEMIEREVLLTYRRHVERIEQWIKYLMDTGMELCSSHETLIEIHETTMGQTRKIVGGLHAAGTRMILAAFKLSREEFNSSLRFAEYEASLPRTPAKPCAREEHQQAQEAVQKAEAAYANALKEESCDNRHKLAASAAHDEITPVRAAKSNVGEVLSNPLAREAEAVFGAVELPLSKKDRRRERRQRAQELAQAMQRVV